MAGRAGCFFGFSFSSAPAPFPSQIIKVQQTANVAAYPDGEDGAYRKAWKDTFFKDVGAAVGALVTSGKLKTARDWAAAWIEIAIGLGTASAKISGE